MGTKINPQNAWIILNKDENSKLNNGWKKPSIFIYYSIKKKNKMEKKYVLAKRQN